jgi:hypothetical protein
MIRLPVASTTLTSAAYSAPQSLLELEFCNGTLYRFFDVPADCFQSLLASDSKGVYFNRKIRNRFRYEQLPAPNLQPKQEN